MLISGIKDAGWKQVTWGSEPWKTVFLVLGDVLSNDLKVELSWSKIYTVYEKIKNMS
jgi:hypothetical protein